MVKDAMNKRDCHQCAVSGIVYRFLTTQNVHQYVGLPTKWACTYYTTSSCSYKNQPQKGLVDDRGPDCSKPNWLTPEFMGGSRGVPPVPGHTPLFRNNKC
jgi:hypothetical protein